MGEQVLRDELDALRSLRQHRYRDLEDTIRRLLVAGVTREQAEPLLVDAMLDVLQRARGLGNGDIEDTRVTVGLTWMMAEEKHAMPGASPPGPRMHQL